LYYYENERWYVISGYIPTMLERPHYSDKTGNFKIDPSKVNL